MTLTQAKRQLGQGSFLYLTLGNAPCYQIDNRLVPKKVAHALTSNLFSTLVPQEDGLFPGFSQTWKETEL